MCREIWTRKCDHCNSTLLEEQELCHTCHPNKSKYVGCPECMCIFPKTDKFCKNCGWGSKKKSKDSEKESSIDISENISEINYL